MFSFQPGSGILDVHVGVKAAAIEANGTQVPLFTLYIVSTCAVLLERMTK